MKKKCFKDINEVINFLELSNFSEFSIIEVAKKCYFTKRELRVFPYYVDYLEGRRQVEIGYLTGMTQPAVSDKFKRCIKKLRILKECLPKARKYIEVIDKLCTLKGKTVLFKALAGIHFSEIAKEFKCSTFNINFICKSSLRKLYKNDIEAFNWTYSMLKLKILKNMKIP